MGEVQVASSGKQNNRSTDKKETEVSCWNCFTTEDTKDRDLEAVTLAEIREKHRENLRLYPFIVSELSKPKTVPLKQKVSEQYIVTKKINENLTKNVDLIKPTIGNDETAALNTKENDETSTSVTEVTLNYEIPPGKCNQNNADNTIFFPTENLPFSVTSKPLKQITADEKNYIDTNDFFSNENIFMSSMKSQDISYNEIFEPIDDLNSEEQASKRSQNIKETVKFQKNDKGYSNIITVKTPIPSFSSSESGNQKEIDESMVKSKYNSIVNDEGTKIRPNFTASSPLEVYSAMLNAIPKHHTDTKITRSEKSFDDVTEHECVDRTFEESSKQIHDSLEPENLTLLSVVEENHSSINSNHPFCKKPLDISNTTTFLKEENDMNKGTTVKEVKPETAVYQRGESGVPVDLCKIPKATSILTKQKALEDDQLVQTDGDVKENLEQQSNISDKKKILHETSKNVSAIKQVKPILENFTGISTTALSKTGEIAKAGLKIPNVTLTNKTKSNVLVNQPVLLKQICKETNSTQDTSPIMKSPNSSRTHERRVKDNSILISKDTNKNKNTHDNDKEVCQVITRNSKIISSDSRKGTTIKKERENSTPIASEFEYGETVKEFVEETVTKNKCNNLDNKGYTGEVTEEESVAEKNSGFSENDTNSVSSIPSLFKTSDKTILKTSSLTSGINNAGRKLPSKSLRWSTLSVQPKSFSFQDEVYMSESVSPGHATLPRRSNSPLPHERDLDRDRFPLNRSGLQARSESMASVYSGAGEGMRGNVTIRGEVQFSLLYNYRLGALEVGVRRCRDLAPIDVKRNRSDPYVKVYLLPDKSKAGKRKTKVKKNTLNPVFEETLSFVQPLASLSSRTLWLSAWHADMFGRNDFLGEVTLPLADVVFDDPAPMWYKLHERTEQFDEHQGSRGDLIVGLKFELDPAARGKGTLHVLVKEAKNLVATKPNGLADVFCKSYLLPERGRLAKQKTSVVRRSLNPRWEHTFTYRGLALQQLGARALELSLWDRDRLASNDFMGAVRLSLGTGTYMGASVNWMDSTGKEVFLWQTMMQRPNFWVERSLPLRPQLNN